MYWSWSMDKTSQQNEKITLPKELQQQMIKFFLKTSIPRKKNEKINLSSEPKTDGRDEE